MCACERDRLSSAAPFDSYALKGVPAMPHYFTPHTPEWFRAQKAFAPAKAAMTQVAVRFGANLNVCSICGDEPAQDYQLIDEFMEDDALATIRLCDDCLRIKKAIHREILVPYRPVNQLLGQRSK